MLAVTYTDATSTAPSSVTVRGTLAGLSPGNGGWHVHSGYSCAQNALDPAYENLPGNRVSDAAGPAHYGDTSSSGGSDPWSGIEYTADAAGVAHLDKTMTGCANLTSPHPTPPSFGTAPRPSAPRVVRTASQSTWRTCCLSLATRSSCTNKARVRASAAASSADPSV